MNDNILEDSVLATVDELNLFVPPAIQSAIQRSATVEFRPTTQLNDSTQAPVNFSLGGDSRMYLDLS